MTRRQRTNVLTAEALLIALPFIFCLYPTLALITTRSEVPVFFNSYSRDLLLLNIFIVLNYIGFTVGLVFNLRGLQAAAVLLIASLMLMASNNAIKDLPALQATTQLVRITAGISLIVIAYLADRKSQSRWSGIGIGVGVLLLITGAIDLSFSSLSQFMTRDKQSEIFGKYRTEMDLSKIGENDIVLVGDSFVWGAGVPVEQRFGDVLERKIGGSRGSRVYSLGVVGAGVSEYNRQILDIAAGKRAKQVIVFFYANDMPPRADLRDTLDKVAVTIGQRSISGRVLSDLVRFVVTPSPEAYAKELLDNFSENDKTFSFRWGLLKAQLETFFLHAEERSKDRPVLVILPMLVSSVENPFEEPHRRVAALAQEIGFRVVNTAPAFQSTGQNLELFRAAANDLHLNERGNAIVADVVMEILGGPARARK